MLTNQERFDPTKYNDESIVKESDFVQKQVDQKVPNFREYNIQKSELTDETSFVQVGQSTTKTFYGKNDSSMLSQASSWDVFPTKQNPFTKYKFTSVEINLNKTLNVINRETYSLLDWLGDCGGLFDALLIIGELFMGPFTSYVLTNNLIAGIVRKSTYPRSEEISSRKRRF